MKQEPLESWKDREGKDLFSDLKVLEQLCEDWPEQYRLGATARVNAVEGINKEAFQRLIKFLKGIPEVQPYLKEIVKDEVIFSVLRNYDILKPTIQERIEESLNRVRPMLRGHGGDIDFLGFQDGVVRVSFTGACDGCPASTVTFYEGVKKALLEDIPEIKEIHQVKSPSGGHNRNQDIRSPFEKSQRWKVIGLIQSFPVNRIVFMQEDKTDLLVYRREEEITCYENACAHLGMSLEGGIVETGIITCPHHGFQYSLDTGECLTAPEIQLKPRRIRLREGKIELLLNG